VHDQPNPEVPVAETLPERYRAVLDRIADLEASGRRHEADDVRRRAISAYSRVWNARTGRRLDALAARAEHLMTLPPLERRRRSRLGFAWLASRHLSSLRAGRAPQPAIAAQTPTPEPPPA
jgi:hypothetical protein